mmetsp:Transcript_1490/g.2131  ORF Transcript_1490/g.2131 Transcript_1490/m.2131 type:complete len:4632 (-) Transcript_1490:106-14001(-)
METKDFKIADVDSVITYLCSVAHSLLKTDAKTLNAALRQSLGKLKEFTTEGHTRRLIVRRSFTADHKESFSVFSELKAYTTEDGEKDLSVLFIKTYPQLMDGIAFASQIYACQIKDGTPYEAMLNFVRHAFLPYSRSIIATDNEDSKKYVDFRTVHRELSALEVSLLRCQQNIEIPEVQLQVNPLIQELVKNAKAKRRKPVPEDMQKMNVDVDNVLNNLTKDLQDWKKLILSVTELDRDVSVGTTKEEIHFWGSMEKSLSKIQRQLKQPGVELTFDVLKHHQKFFVTTAFNEEANLSKCQHTVKLYNELLRDFPVRSLIEAINISDLKDAISAIFKHLKIITRIKYPIERAFKLIRTISRDIAEQLRSILSAKRPMQASFEEFNGSTKDSKDLFRKWDIELQLFYDDIRHAHRDRSESSWRMQMNEPFPAINSLKKRIREVRQLRKDHFQLIHVIENTLEKGSIVRASSRKQIDEAYEHLKTVEVMDTSPEANELWRQAMRKYESKIEFVESELEKRIRELLDKAKGDANEMFRVCEKFNSLFVRPRIQSAIREYQQPLMNTVKKGISTLHEKYKQRYKRSEANQMSTLKDLPPVSGEIIWLKQIENQLKKYMIQVEQVLGKKWHHHVDGKALHDTYKLFCDKLGYEIRQCFDNWILSWKKSRNDASKDLDEGKVFKIETIGQKPNLVINFEKKLVTLFKEVRNLTNLTQMRVPYEIQIKAGEARVRYPSAVRLKEVIRIYNRTCARLDTHPDLEPLAAGMQKDVQSTIEWAVTDSLLWTSDYLHRFVAKLGSFTQRFQEQVDDLILKNKEIEVAVERLAKVDPTREALEGVIKEIQDIVDHIEKTGASNLGVWVQELDNRLERILSGRLKELMALWSEGVELSPTQLYEWNNDIDAHEKDGKKVENILHKRHILKIMQPELKNPIQHNITIRSGVLVVDPPLQNARLRLGQSFQRLLSVICKLPRVHCLDTRKLLEENNNTIQERYEALHFASALQQLNVTEINECFLNIESQVAKAHEYASTWLQYQALWDMDVETVLKVIQEDVNSWEQLLRDMKKSRNSFDDPFSQKAFGPIIVKYLTVQQKVVERVDSWHRTIMNRFSKKLNERMRQTFNATSNGRKSLEELDMDFSNTDVLIKDIMDLQELNQNANTWQEDIKAQQGVEKMLDKQRFMFPNDWLYAEQVIGEYTSFSQILAKKMAILKEKTPTLQKHITDEDVKLTEELNKFTGEWKTNRPVDGDLDYKKVIKSLGFFQSRLERLQEQLGQMENAKGALGMPVREDKTLDPIEEELKGLQEVWDQLGKIWDRLDNLGETKFNTIKPEKVRGELKRMQGDLLNLPDRLRSYDAYDGLKKRLEDYQKLYIHFVTLRSPVLRAKHRAKILKLLGLKEMTWDNLQVSNLWGCGLRKFKADLEAIAENAQGEAALEEYLLAVQSTWEDYQFVLANYQGKCFLIRNYNPLFKQLTEHLTDLSAMKQSPFFKAFEDKATRWESILSNSQACLETFADVQRRWIYLEGIFSSSVDVQQQLAFQFRRFKTFDREFVRLMRDIKLDPKILDWLPKPPLIKKLEGYQDLLTTIQKALGAYLEKQRSQFPRFYFVGDDDLLEIIGNAKDPMKVLRHLPKMFGGITSLALKDKTITGMSSREGEQVEFDGKVNVADCKSIHDWLSRVETLMRITLAQQLASQAKAAETLTNGGNLDMKRLESWIGGGAAQVTLLSAQSSWSKQVDSALKANSKAGGKQTSKHIQPVLDMSRKFLSLMAKQILNPMSADKRKKYEQLITEVVHQRDVAKLLIEMDVASNEDFNWLANMRFNFDDEVKEPEKKLSINISRASFFYGFEYLGVGERLVQTPLTDRCYLTLCEALHMRMGGNPFGPAGTGKTESVKMLGSQLGRFVLVFCCDESFDLAAMSRIFVGLCQCGAWGCFDEFNRLEERILSAVSQQIQVIQEGLKEKKEQIELLSKPVILNPKMGIFVTMNPGYAGRSALPDNLKQLFRGMAMMKPDRNLIAQVTLYSQGFRTAELLSSKVVLLFQLCKDQLSSQSHYDFGLRSLKSVLRSAGALKRKDMTENEGERGEDADWKAIEQELLVRSMCMTIVPKLISQDLGLFQNLLSAVFPEAKLMPPNVEEIRKAVIEICKEENLLPTESWINKIMELNQVQTINHGLIMVGPSGSGKTTAWRVLLAALERVDKTVKSVYHVIDPKAINKDELYGTLDPINLEWTNGVFTYILRQILDNTRGDGKKRHWIVFDGDVDPEWAENLNSVLDDNKLLTLPNGERIMLSSNIRVMFEVENLNYATPATVSRCGMVWFNPEVVSMNMVCSNLLLNLKSKPIKAVADNVYRRWKNVQEKCCEVVKSELRITLPEDVKYASALSEAGSPYIDPIFDYCKKQSHIMPFQRMRVMGTLFSLLSGGISRIMTYNDTNSGFPLDDSKIESFMQKYIVMAVVWAFGGSMSLSDRTKFCEEMHSFTNVKLPNIEGKMNAGPLIDFNVTDDMGEWELWSDSIEPVELEPEKIPKPDVVITTVDTYRHSVIIGAAVADHRPLILCGPPGSGKSMTLTAVLRRLPNFELVTLNFSSSTDPEFLVKTISHYCTTSRTPKGLVMRPTQQDKWLVIFCDEINLPVADKYNTQPATTFLRQLIEQGGFWNAKELAWVNLERVQIIGACNPPTDAGRVAMTPRFLRHCMLLFVDFPGEASLKQIYGTFNRALVKKHAALRSYAPNLTDAMVEFYLMSQRHFTPDMQPHYIYSPRELSRWVRAMYEATDTRKLQGHTLLPDDLVRLFAHEALRLFQDRLVEKSERDWTDNELNECVKRHFTGVDTSAALRRPILFSEWLSKRYESVEQEELRKHVIARLHTFNEEELDVKLVVFDEVLEHILRIDRVLRQPLGHLLLVGASGSGKTILSKFVSWMNGMKVFQLKVHKYYTAKNFDEDLRALLIRAGCKHEKTCFIFDESNVLDTAFLERMNALLASGEVPGLFEDADFKNLMAECKDQGRRDGEILGSDEERYKRFCRLVQRNLHVVFTMNPSNEDFDNRSATSPALFNRCVIDWFGEWSKKALYQVGYSFTKSLDLGDIVDEKNDIADIKTKGLLEAIPGTQRDSIVNTMVYIHTSVQDTMETLAKAKNGRATFVTPRHYLDFIKHYKKLFIEKREDFEEQQRHLLKGLQKLKQTEETVEKMRVELNVQNKELKKKEIEAKQKMVEIQKNSVEAEAKTQASKKIKAEQEEQNKIIAARRTKVEADLAQAGPALEEAKKSVSNIKRKDLDNIRKFARPPEKVRLAMEPVVIMVSGKVKAGGDWKSIQKALSKSDFIPKILSFNTRKLKPAVRAHIEKKYIKNPEYNFENINRASTACGPLVKWVRSQLSFSIILNSVAPMEKELSELESKGQILKEQQEKISVLLEDLDRKVKSYSEEYKILITEAARIEDKLKLVKNKVDRSITLLRNLGSERQRWSSETEEYNKQMVTVAGDTLLSGAFLAYIGYFNQGYRKALFDTWMDQLRSREVPIKIDLSIIEYLSEPGERLEWKAHRLPDDNLCYENAIMMTRFNRYPLIIDPSGQAVTFLMDWFNHRSSSTRKMIRTSFLDSSFLQHLESALRFGNAILVEDVESIDPVLNSVLNKEITKTAGRVMITVGAKEIDFSPKFTIFLSTRDPFCHFTPDLCSRVTFVNFTATHASLASQCLNKVLKKERPDIDQKRSDLLRLQGEFRVELRKLEDQLLVALNSVKTNILEDEQVMETLETLKNKSTIVDQKMKDSEQDMETINKTALQYEPFARLCSKIYFTLEEFSTLHFLYQFSLPFFLQLVDDTIDTKKNKKLNLLPPESKSKPAARLEAIRQELFDNALLRVGRALLQKDQVAYALRLTQIAMSERGSQALEYKELQFLLKVEPTTLGLVKIDVPKSLNLSKSQVIMLEKLSKQCDGFKNIASHMSSNISAWQSYIQGAESKDGGFAQCPTGWENGAKGEIRTQFRELLLSKVLRPEGFDVISRNFIEKVFGKNYLDTLNDPHLEELVSKETRAGTPILLVTFPGYDASVRVTELAQKMGIGSKFAELAMGSPEGFSQANEAIEKAQKRGEWVLLKNVHLAPAWLSKLEKRLHRLEPHNDFRIFMTMEVNPRVPTNLIRMSNVVILEPPSGLRSSMQRIFKSLPAARVNRAPAERSRLYFLLAWLHSIILERLRYTPVGWTKTFEFSEADQRCAMDSIDEWVDRVAQGRLNVDPEKLPWDAIRESLKKTIYGGRVDNKFDQKRLEAFVGKLFSPRSFGLNFPIASFHDEKEKKLRTLLKVPDQRNFEGFNKWVKGMEDLESPEYLGLPSNAKVLLQREQTKRTLRILNKLQAADNDVERTSIINEPQGGRRRSITSQLPPWWSRIKSLFGLWRTTFPPHVSNLKGKTSSALLRSLQREIMVFKKIHATILSDVKTGTLVFEGKQQAGNTMRSIFKSLGEQEVVPKAWSITPSSAHLTPSNWMQDFIRKIRNINRIAETPVHNIGSKPLWLGGLLSPEAFVAASRQEVAQRNKCSLDSLWLKVTVSTSDAPLKDDFIFQGLTLHGAACVSNVLTPNNQMSQLLPFAHFQWCELKTKPTNLETSTVVLPVYADSKRKRFLFEVRLPYDNSYDANLFSQRGTCLTVWAPSA